MTNATETERILKPCPTPTSPTYTTMDVSCLGEEHRPFCSDHPHSSFCSSRRTNCRIVIPVFLIYKEALQWRAILIPLGHLTMSAQIFSYGNQVMQEFLVNRVRFAAKHLTIHKIAPHPEQRNYPTQDNSNGKVELLYKAT